MLLLIDESGMPICDAHGRYVEALTIAEAVALAGRHPGARVLDDESGRVLDLAAVIAAPQPAEVTP